MINFSFISYWPTYAPQPGCNC